MLFLVIHLSERHIFGYSGYWLVHFSVRLRLLASALDTSKGIVMVDSKKCNSSTIAFFYCLSFKKNFEVTMVLGMSDPQFNTYK
jgi:hypothetical protein